MEREANELLAKGYQEAAAAKFTEADRLSTGEALAAANVKAEVATKRAADPAVQQIAANDPAGAPDLAAPNDPPAAQPAAAPAPQPIAPPAAATPAAQPAAAPDSPRRTAPLPLRHAGASGNRGEVLLGEAKDLYKSGNYQASRQLAIQAKTGKFGVEAQADELIAQIGLAEQGGAAQRSTRSGPGGHADR